MGFTVGLADCDRFCANMNPCRCYNSPSNIPKFNAMHICSWYINTGEKLT